MIEMVNRATGTTMWVADARVSEYLQAGHSLAMEVEKPAEPVKDGKLQPKRTVRKKAR